MKVLILVNTLNAVNSFIYSNHIGFLTHVKKQFPNDQIIFFTPPRMSIDMARNSAAKAAMENECDYLMFLDDDVLVPENTLEELIRPDADICAGLVIIRGYPFNVMAFTSDENRDLPYFNDLPLDLQSTEDRVILKDPVTQDDGLIAVGFSCCLIKVSLLKKIPTPFFITGPRNTEDIYFCLKAKTTLDSLRENDPSVPKLKIAMATNVQCGHQLHPEPIEWRTREVFQEFYEALDPNLKARTNRPQDLRDKSYIEKNMKEF